MKINIALDNLNERLAQLEAIHLPIPHPHHVKDKSECLCVKSHTTNPVSCGCYCHDKKKQEEPHGVEYAVGWWDAIEAYKEKIKRDNMLLVSKTAIEDAVKYYEFGINEPRHSFRAGEIYREFKNVLAEK